MLYRLSFCFIAAIHVGASLSVDALGTNPKPTQAAIARTIEVKGRNREFLIHRPEGNNGAAPLPLLIAFHGRSQSHRSMESFSDLNSHSDAAQFVVVYPNALDGTWRVRGEELLSAGEEAPDDFLFISSLIEQLILEKVTLPSRVFLAGFSNGAVMANLFAAKNADKVAGLVTVAGTLPDESITLVPSRPIPLRYLHGTSDRIFTQKGVGFLTHKKRSLSVDEFIGWWAEKNGLGATAKLDTIEDTATDGTPISVSTFLDATDRPSVVLYQIRGGGHTWPGGKKTSSFIYGKTTGNINASKLIADFIRSSH